MACCSLKIATIVLGVGALFFILFGSLFGWIGLPAIVDDQIWANVELRKGTEQFERWEVTPVALEFRVVPYNIKNPVEVLAGEIPIVEELGTFTYLKSTDKRELKYHPEDDTWSYYQYMNYNDSLVTNGNAKFNMINIPLMAVAMTLEAVPALMYVLKNGQANAFPNAVAGTNELFLEMVVSEFAFDGYRFCNPANYGGNRWTRQLCAAIRLQGNEQTPVDPVTREISFSMFAFMQNNHDGHWRVSSGMRDVRKLGHAVTWEDQPYTNYWKGEKNNCDRVRGGDSMIYPPYNADGSSHEVFSTDICRVVHLKYWRDSEYKEVPTKRYALKDDTLGSAEEYPANECFCVNNIKMAANDHETCLPHGFNDLYNCFHAPMILSFPHFLYADKEWADKINDPITPNAEIHSTYVEMEPATGTPLSGAKAVQFNMLIRKVPEYPHLDLVKDAILPIVWINEAVDLPDHLVDIVKDEYLRFLPLIDAARWTLIAVGIAMTVGAAIVGYMWVRQRKAVK